MQITHQHIVKKTPLLTGYPGNIPSRKLRITLATTVLALAEHMVEQTLSQPFRGERGSEVYLKDQRGFIDTF